MQAFTINGTIELSGLNQATQGLQGLNKQAGTTSVSLQQMGKQMAIAGAAITASLGAMVKSFVSTGSELKDLSTITQIGAGRLAGYKYAAEQNSATLGDFEMAIKRTSVAITEAKNNVEESTKAFKLMGLSIDELEGLSPQAQFETIARAIAKIPDPIQRSAAAVAVFGRSGTSILPTLINQFEETVQKGQELSGWTDDMAAKADELGDAFDTLKFAGEGLFNQIGSALAPMLKSLADTVTNATGAIKDFAAEHPAITEALSGIALSFGGVLTTVGALSFALPKLIGLLKSVGGILGGGALAGAGALGLVAGVAYGSWNLFSAASSQDNYIKAVENFKKLDQEFKDGKLSVDKYIEAITALQVAAANFQDPLTQDTSAQRQKLIEFLETLKGKYQEVASSATSTSEEISAAIIAQAQAAQEAFNSLLENWQYENSILGQLGLTMNDIYTIALDMGYSIESVNDLYLEFGTTIGNIDELLQALGWTYLDLTNYINAAAAAQAHLAQQLANNLAYPQLPIELVSGQDVFLGDKNNPGVNYDIPIGSVRGHASGNFPITEPSYLTRVGEIAPYAKVGEIPEILLNQSQVNRLGGSQDMGVVVNAINRLANAVMGQPLILKLDKQVLATGTSRQQLVDKKKTI